MSRNQKSRRRIKRTGKSTSGVRIIAGQWRGRRLAVAEQEGLRPTTDRVRETLFNWLQFELSGARCLDLFAGSGVLGLEALSRQAAHLDFVDSARAAQDCLRENIQTLNASELCQLHASDALAYLRNYRGPSYDLVFLDPPYAAPVLDDCVQLLEQNHLLAAGAFIVCEHASDAQLALPSAWQLWRQLKTKRSHVSVFCCDTGEST